MWGTNYGRFGLPRLPSSNFIITYHITYMLMQLKRKTPGHILMQPKDLATLGILFMCDSRSNLIVDNSKIYGKDNIRTLNWSRNLSTTVIKVLSIAFFFPLSQCNSIKKLNTYHNHLFCGSYQKLQGRKTFRMFWKLSVFLEGIQHHIEVVSWLTAINHTSLTAGSTVSNFKGTLVKRRVRQLTLYQFYC